MINKQNLWFITLFSLILILGIYYVSIPGETLSTFSENLESEPQVVSASQSDVLVAMKVEEEEKILKEIDDTQSILLNENSSLEEKNKAYEELLSINKKKGNIEKLESAIKKEFNLDSCVQFNDNNIAITVNSSDKGKEFANDIIRFVQSKFEDKMYITVKFQNS